MNDSPMPEQADPNSLKSVDRPDPVDAAADAPQVDESVANNGQEFVAELESEHELPTGVLDIKPSADDENTIFAACMDGVYRVDRSSSEVRKLYEHESYASGVVVDRNRDILISAGYDGQLIWYDLQRQSVVRRVVAHSFWSWQLAISPDQRTLATATGQYLAGSEDYTPAPEQEPSVKLYDVATGELRQQLSHVPSVHSVAFSPDGQFVAAGNLMGEIRVWHIATGQLERKWTTDDFTSWGIIKSHCYIGGIHAMVFTPDSQDLVVAGMGPMRDPMAGNGRQLWQRFAWRETEPRLVDQTHDGESGEGLMETLTWSPCGRWFAMGGRQRGGDWNAAFFSAVDGRRLHHLSTGYRMTSAQAVEGRLITAGANRQKAPEDGTYPAFGIAQVYRITLPTRVADASTATRRESKRS